MTLPHPQSPENHDDHEQLKRLERIEQHQVDVVKRALAEGLLHDPTWIHKKNEPMPVWAVLEVALLLLEKLDPPCATYD